jgi:hypothetical protein
MRIVDSSGKPIAKPPKIAGAVSADVFTGVNVPVGPGGVNPAILMPAHKMVDGMWRIYSADSRGTESAMRALPPPLQPLLPD